MGASDFPPPLFPSSLFRLVGKCVCYAPTMGSPGLLPILNVRLEAAYDPGWVRHSHHNQCRAVACWRLDTIGPFQSGHFGTLHLHGQHYLLPLILACFRTYASSALLPVRLQGSIPGPWLAVTGAGFTPARICSIAQPQPRPDLVRWFNRRMRKTACPVVWEGWRAQSRHLHPIMTLFR